MDEGLHRLLHLATPWRHNRAVEASNRTCLHLLEALLHDLRRLAHFFIANHEAIITGAIRADGDFKVHAIIDIVGLRPAKIPGNAGAADHWTGKAPFDRVFLADHRDIHVALFEDAIVDYKTQRIVEQFRQFGIEPVRSAEHTSELQSLMRISYAVFCLKNKTQTLKTYSNI